MTLNLDEPPAVRMGEQRPRVCSLPPSAVDFEEGRDAIELAEMAGLVLDPWQQWSLTQMLARRADGAWAAFEAALVVPRQNGKTMLLAAYELAALFLHRERLVIHSAHQYDTSMEAMRLLLELVEGTPELSRQVKPRGVSRSHGAEGIELRDNRRIRFRTRTKGGGRGFSGGRLVFDEAMMFPVATHSALMYVVSSQPEKQIVYAGSAVDQQIHEDGWVLAGLRERALQGDDPSLAYMEFSAGDDITAAMDPDFAGDPVNWLRANPAIGVRPGITTEHIANEYRASRVSNLRGFLVERCGVGDWPIEGDHAADEALIEPAEFEAIKDDASAVAGPSVFALDVRLVRGDAAAAIGEAGLREDGLAHFAVRDHRPGTAWLVHRAADLQAQNPEAVFRYEERSPAAAFVRDLTAADVKLEPVNSAEHARSCGRLVDLLDNDQVRHPGLEQDDYPALLAAVATGRPKNVGEALAWSRSRSEGDITPLVAVTLALGGVGDAGKQQAGAVLI